MRKIGLTGGIASGKTTVSNILKDLGAHIVDADIVARKIVEKGQPAWKEIKKEFGNIFLCEDGSINRAKLGDKVFNDSAALKKLNDITHPVIYDEINKKIQQISLNDPQGIIVVDAALLIEKGWYNVVDTIWLVIANEDIRLNRLMKRNNLTKEEALKRINSQMTQEEKKIYADEIIDNSGEIEETKMKIIKLWNRLLAQ